MSSEIISIGGNITGGSLPAVGSSGANGGATTTFAFGDLNNVVDLTQDGLDEIIVQLTAVLIDDPLNATGDVLTNTSTLSFIDGNGDAASASDPADITVCRTRVGHCQSGCTAYR